ARRMCPDECGVTRGLDKDAFDKDDTVYIIERVPGSGEVVGFCRINPTTRPHMMTEVFPHYCNYDGIPTGPNIHEVSRLGYDYRVLGRDRDAWREVRARITTAITFYCLRRRISQVTFCVHDDIYMAIKRDTWGARPLGAPQHDEKLDKIYQAGISDITPEALERCRSNLEDPDRPPLDYFGPIETLQLPEAA
ncbi:MAG: acyl-homoserine-lactone synthase, partial [Pseudomonadota bacterium]